MSLRRSARISINPNDPPTIVAKDDTVAKPSKRVAKPVAKTEKPATKKRKVSSSNGAAQDGVAPNDDAAGFAVPILPVTPNSKRQRTAPNPNPPPPTLTPSAVGFNAEPQPQPASKSPSKAARSRPAAPQATNALLATPGGTKVAAYSNTSPVKWSSDVPRPTTTTENLLDEACKHLITVDPKLKAVIEKHHCKEFSPEGLAEKIDPFESLTSSIIAQQVSGAAAASIQKKFIGLFPPTPNGFPTPTEVAATSLEKLRTAGLSQRKAEYIQGLAEKFASGELSARMLIEATDQEVMDKLVAVRGLGRWSVEMFACFGLKRMDVFSTGDLGIQRGMAVWLGKDVAKLKNKSGKWKYMTEKEMLEHSEKFAPYRSLFMWYLWRIVDVDVSVLQSS